MHAPVSLLCLPCAGASAMAYLRWRRLLPQWINVVPVELPGRGSRFTESLVEDFDALVTQLCAEQKHLLNGRYALFGHSMGALLAYGMTLRVQQQGGVMPQALLVGGSSAPSRRDNARFTGNNDDATLIADMRKQGGTPQEVFDSAELIRITLDVLRADYRICGSFRRAADASPLSVPIHAFSGLQDDIDADCIDAWSIETSKTFTLDWFDGGHFFVRQQEEEMLAAITQRLLHGAAGTVGNAHASVAAA